MRSSSRFALTLALALGLTLGLALAPFALALALGLALTLALLTPRDARIPPAQVDRSSKKPRDDESPSAAPLEDSEPYAELYSHPEWEMLSVFERDDLLEEGVFALLCFSADRKTPLSVMLWIGAAALALG